ncbi:helicase [Lichenihabitans sp. PAMC28606]|uniref:helicase-related protein n=1 Tax=Lichenihabitans sp. PAMC28606 TaxID=2880932 RepID=UPI001D0A34CE|nr:helicase-related protein [Lichenihabitans sp. PAMC28606]UDL94551.1 helicase [Lichenihabitans sp. PAMC28606]
MDLDDPATFGWALPRGVSSGRFSGAGVTAVLGPTNTGKTHYAIERMLSHPSGIIGLPLRLLAREVYNRVVEKAGADNVALITGEERIKPKRPRYWVATVEAMPRDLDVSFLAIDEIQIAASLDRGHVFTDRLLNRRGRHETLLIGAMTMKPVIEHLLPGVTIVSRPRLSKLTFAGEKKLSRLPHRSAIVAFSAEEVYAIAELIRRQRGGAAVVLGALSPRTRNAQVAMYQDGEVDYLVATDAIGMGLNLDVDHVAFAGDRKFDGWQYRRLNPAEFGQIAGRAGRHLKDGTFGTTGRCPPFDEEEIEALEDHRFGAVNILQWRNTDLDFSSVEALQQSLDVSPDEAGLTRAPLAEDVMVLDIAARDVDVRRHAKTRADIARLWEVCQVPDYRKVSPSAHADLALTLFGFVVRAGRIPDDWFSRQLAAFERTDGDIDTLSARIAQVRTLTFIANRPDWLGDPEHWQGVARQVEDRLSDALHERLAQRFVDRRTSVLMRRLRENAMLEAEVTPQGDVLVEGQNVGQLHGFRFTADPSAAGEAAKALNTAALKALAGEIDARAERFSASVDESIALANDGTIRWLGDPIAKLTAGDGLLAPRARLVADEHLTGPALEMVQRRLDLWLAQHVKKLLGPVMDLEAGEGLEGIARGIAYQAAEALGVLERSRVAEEMKNLDQTARGALRKLGLRFGAYNIYLPLSLKPAPRALAAQLWALKHGGTETIKGLDDVPYLAASGRTSFPADKDVPKGLYRAAGFRVCGERAVRVDILERLADLIRPAIAYRPGTTPGAPPPGAADNNGFVTTVAMTSLAGCSGEDFASILRSLGYVLDRRVGPPITVPLLPTAPTEPLRPVATPAVTDGSPSNEHLEADAAPIETETAHHEPRAEQLEATSESEVAEAPSAVPVDAAEGEASAPGSAAPHRMDEMEAERVQEFNAPEEFVESAARFREDPVTAAVEQPAPAAEAASAEEPALVASHQVTEPISAVPDDRVAANAHATAETSIESTLEVSGENNADAPDATLETAAAADEPDVPAEPVLIDVWRPHRTAFHAEKRNDRPARQRPQGRGGERDNRRPHGGTGRDQPTPTDMPVAAVSGVDAPTMDATATPASQARPDRDARPDRQRDQRPGGNQRSRPGGGRRDDRPRQGGDQAPRQSNAGAPDSASAPRGRPEGERNRDRRNERPENARSAGASFASTERPTPRDRQPDPNSPFAKLLALKAELEGRSKKDT